MINMDCVYEKSYHFVIGAVFALLGTIFTLLGVSVIPVVGLLIAAPLFAFAWFFFRNPSARECGITP